MPQLTSLVLKDGAATPVDHTFEPREVSQGIATLVESNGIPIGDRKITLSVSRTAQGRVKATMKLVIPVVTDQTLNGVTRPTVVRTAYADVTFSYDGSSNTQERKDIIAYVRNALAANQTMVSDSFVNLNGIY